MDITSQEIFYLAIDGEEIPVKGVITIAGKLSDFENPLSENYHKYEGHIICEFVDENTDD